MFRLFLPLFVIVCVSVPNTSATTVLLLKNGGSLRGELLNPDEINRKTHRVKTAEGIEITLDAKLVERIQPRERDALIEYNRDAPLTEKTVENHVAWARWCTERQLFEQSKVHWQQVLELDPDHVDARRVLGYIQTQDGWESHRDRLEGRGLIEDRGRWKTPYEIRVSSMLGNREQAEQQWERKIRELLGRLPHTQGELLSIRDPFAVIPIRNVLADRRFSNQPHIRVLLLQVLMQINDPDWLALQLVVGWTIRPEENEEIRRLCLEEVQKRINAQPEIRGIVIAVYRSALKTKDNQVVYLAAEILGNLGNVGGREAVPELIDALETTVTDVHRTQAQGPSFGPSGSGGLQWGTSTVRNQRLVGNQAVLAALVKLTGENYGFNQEAWRAWHRQPYRSPPLNLRRS